MRYLTAVILIVIYILFCWFYWQRHSRYQKKRIANIIGSTEILIGYTSQTGSAAYIASRVEEQLQTAQLSCELLPLNQIKVEHLQANKIFLVVASTYGEGEAPDNGNRFIARTLGKVKPDSLQHLQVAILGLGDSSYKRFCGFAHQLQHELQHRGVHFLTDVIEVDKLDESALRHWQYYLGQISGHTHFADWSKPGYSEWKIVQRECINPGSPGAPAFHIKLRPIDNTIPTAAWQAGDIAEIGPGNSAHRIQQFLQQLGRDSIAPELLQHSNLVISEQRLAELKVLDDSALVQALADLPHREYSIASVPAENSLDLLVRQVNLGSDHYGLGSGWLSVYAQLHQPIRLRIRTNAHFHSPDSTCPLILIGNGTGIAGLRAHLANPARIGTRNWLLFGERTATADNFFAADIHHWQSTGLLTRVDRIFSRDAQPGEPRYVQDLLQANAQELQRWVEEGAAIFVCGSLQGMAQAVDDVLRNILGARSLELMADQRRYCRDVY